MWFQQVFAGNPNAYGTYSPASVRDSDGKKKGIGRTVKEPVNSQLFQDHLSGVRRLGIIPIRPDGTVRWFAGDVDKYDIDLAELEKQVQRLELPLVVIRSKSGGAHLFCFLSEDIDAAEAIDAMRSWIAQLSLGKVEIFPKQKSLGATEEGIGNWIHLPYFNAENPDSWAIGLSGEKLSLDQFRQMIQARIASRADLNIKGKKRSESKFDGPPCIETLMKEGIRQGWRNNFLTHYSVYLRMSDPDNGWERIQEFNNKHVNPPAPEDDLRVVFRNGQKPQYQYMCKTEPMCSACDKELCLTRKWGVGPQRGIDYSDGILDRIIKIDTDPPIYYVTFKGRVVKMDSSTLLSPAKFRARIYEITGELVAIQKPRAHESMILQTKTDIEEAPAEVSEDGQIFDLFKEWCEVNVPHATSRSHILRNSPYFDQAEKTVLFRGEAFISFISRKRRLGFPDNVVWASLRKAGCENKNITVDARQAKVWAFKVEEPWFALPTEEQF
jgi:hypothetical protein